MPGGNPTAQAQANQQFNQQQAEQYYQGLVNQSLGGLKSYLSAHPAPANRWAPIRNPVGQTRNFGGGTLGTASVPGGTPFNPAPTPLERALIGTGPSPGKKS